MSKKLTAAGQFKQKSQPGVLYSSFAFLGLAIKHKQIQVFKDDYPLERYRKREYNRAEPAKYLDFIISFTTGVKFLIYFDIHYKHTNTIFHLLCLKCSSLDICLSFSYTAAMSARLRELL